MSEEIYDVAIVGGGPAGSTAAALLARAGRRVIVLERDKFPRFHIGESLLPFSMKAFTRLGLHEKFRAAGFMEKFGGAMFGVCADEGVKFYFEDGFRSQTDRSYQVTRSEFDKVLLDHAEESGADIREETSVEKLDFSPEEVALETATKGHPPETVRARYVIDCAGRNSPLAAQLKLKQNYTHLQKISVFAHYEGVTRESGRDGTLTQLLRAHDRWFWIIPLTENRTSVGVVLDAAVYKKAKLSPEEFLDQTIEEHSLIQRRLNGGERATEAHIASDFSYRCKAPRLYAGYERMLNRAMDVYLRFVNAWYTKEFIEVFLHPQKFLQLPPAVNAVLGGNIGTSFAIRWRMEIFYLIVRLQRYIPLCPRRPLVPDRSSATMTTAALETVS